MLVDSLISIQPKFSVHKLVPNELFVPTGGCFSLLFWIIPKTGQ